MPLKTPMFQRPNTLAHLFRQFRTLHNITQEALALQLKITPNYLWMIENGHRLPSLRLSYRFAFRFRINPGYIAQLWKNQKLILSSSKFESLIIDQPTLRRPLTRVSLPYDCNPTIRPF